MVVCHLFAHMESDHPLYFADLPSLLYWCLDIYPGQHILSLSNKSKTAEQQEEAVKLYKELLGPESLSEQNSSQVDPKTKKNKFKSKHARKKAKEVGLKDLEPLPDDYFDESEDLTNYKADVKVEKVRIQNENGY